MTTRDLIASELRSIRAKKDISLETVATESGVNKDTMCRYENNTVSMQIDILDKLLKYYKVDFDIFFTNIYANKPRKIKT